VVAHPHYHLPPSVHNLLEPDAATPTDVVRNSAPSFHYVALIHLPGVGAAVGALHKTRPTPKFMLPEHIRQL